MSDSSLARGLLISICGVDGVGKTTLVSRLCTAPSLPSIRTLKKTEKSSFNAVAQLSGREHEGWKAWNEGTFAQAMASAAAIDFLKHYRANIVPALQLNELVITDRYHLCYAAYLVCVRSSIDPRVLFEKVRVPDLIIVLDAPTETIATRLESRGGAMEDENAELSGRLRSAYKELVSSYAKRHVVISAIDDEQSIYEQALKEIEREFSS